MVSLGELCLLQARPRCTALGLAAQPVLCDPATMCAVEAHCMWNLGLASLSPGSSPQSLGLHKCNVQRQELAHAAAAAWLATLQQHDWQPRMPLVQTALTTMHNMTGKLRCCCLHKLLTTKMTGSP